MEIDSSIQTEIIKILSEKLKANYVFPEIAGEICLGLQKHLVDGDYADITEGEFFALALTVHLQEVNHDEHLWVKWHPDPLPEEDGSLRNNQAWQEERKAEAGLDNFGIHKLERLPGNIGYIDIRYFHRPAWGGDTVAAAMNFLGNANALIIDLQNCQGGYPGMMALFASYLFGDDPIHLSDIYWRDDDLTQQYWTQPYVPGKHFIDKPVYVLTSKATFSAGEGFASILQTNQRAKIIGEKTDGGSHPGASFRLHPHFEVFIPIGRAMDPKTGAELEGVGVTPDFVLPKEHAFLAAYYMALSEVITSCHQSSSDSIKSLTREAQAALDELMNKYKICPACGYQNQHFFNNCKNCDEPLNKDHEQL